MIKKLIITILIIFNSIILASADPKDPRNADIEFYDYFTEDNLSESFED